MKRITILILAACLLLPIVALAQDVTPEAPSTNVQVNDGGIVVVNPPADVVTPEPAPTELPKDIIMVGIVALSTVVIVGMVLYARHKGLTTQQAFQTLPGVVTDYAYPAAWRYRWSVAQTTPDPADNNLLKEEARFLGYKVTDQPGGGVLLEPDPTYRPPAQG